MPLHVYNTRTRKKEAFVPRQRNIVRIYTCGLTVYSRMHVGHARTYTFWDFFRRYLEYKQHQVISVINYTDIDDRIMGKVTERQGCRDLAERVIASFRQDCRSLRIKDYAAYTRATDFIQEQIDSVAKLVEKGHAYVVDGEVLYSVESFERYGQLSGAKLGGQQAGASGRVTEDLGRKRNAADFTLWKPSGDGQPSWETGHADWPSGRPGWHIECSAMATAMLGDHFDVHGGAVDNLFPHHENELAQSEPLCGHPWVGYWMHPEHLDLRGVKMSKSIGNVIDVPSLTNKFGYDELRWFFANAHYRTKLQFSEELLQASAEGFKKIRGLIERMETRLLAATPQERQQKSPGDYASLRNDENRFPREREKMIYGAFSEQNERFINRFIAACDDDLASPQATAAVFDYVGELNAGGVDSHEDAASVMAAYQTLTRHLYVLGIEFPNEELYPELAVECFTVAGTSASDDDSDGAGGVLDKLVHARTQARKDKDFAKSDLLRDVLADAGVEIEDTSDGPRWKLKD